MASKAYVASMTVTELKQELKQRGLSTRGSKKSLRDRLERVLAIILAPPQTRAWSLTRTSHYTSYISISYTFYLLQVVPRPVRNLVWVGVLINAHLAVFLQAFDEEELNDSSSESESEGKLGPADAGFNFSVTAESFLPPDQIREDSPVLSPEQDKMIISVELSNKETLEVYSPKPPPVSTREDEGGGGGRPLVVAVPTPNEEGLVAGRGVEQQTENHNSIPVVSVAVESVEVPREEKEDAPAIMTNCSERNDVSEVQSSAMEEASTNAASTDDKQAIEPLPTATNKTQDVNVDNVQEKEEEGRGVALTVVDGDGEGGDGGIREESEGGGGVELQVGGEGRGGSQIELGVAAEEGEAGGADIDSSEPLQSVANEETEASLQLEAKEPTVGEEIQNEKVEKEKFAVDEPTTSQGGEEETATADEDEWVIIEQPLSPVKEEGKSEGEGGDVGEVSSGPVEERLPAEVEHEVSNKDPQVQEKEEGKGATAEPVKEEADTVEQTTEDMEIGEEQGEGETAGDQPMEQEEGSQHEEEKEVSTTEDVSEAVQMEDEGQTPATAEATNDALPPTTTTIERKAGAEEEEEERAGQTPCGEEQEMEGESREQQEEQTGPAGDSVQHEDQVGGSVEHEKQASPAEERVQREEQAHEDAQQVQTTSPIEEVAQPVGPAEETVQQVEQAEEVSAQQQAEEEKVEQGQEQSVSVEEKEEELPGPVGESAPTVESAPQEEKVCHGESPQQEDSLTEPTPPTSRSSDSQPLNETAASDRSPGQTDTPAVEEVSEGVNMEVAVLVHAEEDDLSVFSTEAAEAQKIASSREKERVSSSASSSSASKARGRDKDRDKSSSSSSSLAKHRHTSASSAALPNPASSSSSSTGLVEESAGSPGVGSEAAKADAASKSSSPSLGGVTKHSEGDRTEVGVVGSNWSHCVTVFPTFVQNQSEPPSKKRRRISAHGAYVHPSASTNTTATEHMR